MLLNDRESRIIQIIYNSNGCITGKAISLKMAISLRTIQSEISLLNQEIPGLIVSSNRGYSINQEIYSTIKSRILPLNANNTQKNESHTILRKLIFSNTSLQIDELAETLYMSTSVLEKQLKALNPLLENNHLTLSRKNAHLSIEGAESDKRKLFHFLILEETTANFNDINNLDKYFPEMDTEKTKSIIINAIHKFDYFVENIYSANIIINIMVALYRMRSSNYIGTTYYSDVKESDTEYQIASEICAQYANHWNISPSVTDISYVSSLIAGQIKPKSKLQGFNSEDGVLTQAFISQINNILFEVFNSYMLNIDFSDILYNFSLHIDGALKRSSHPSSGNDEILANVKKNCPFVYEVSISIAQKLNEHFGVSLPDTEIGYISIHIGFLIEQSTENSEKLYVLLLSDEYHHISDTIARKLRENFSGLIELEILNSLDNEMIIQIKSDLIISTRPITIIGKKVITISPFYTMIDHINVDQMIHNCLIEKKKNYRGQLLSSFFLQKLFFKRDDFRNKEEVIRFMGQRLIDSGFANDNFIDSVLQRESFSSTCFFDTFAIPHALVLDAKRTMNCVLISEKGIPWDAHKVHIVMMIAVQQEDRKQFMKLYNGIVSSLENTETVNKLVSSNSFSDFIKILRG